MRLIRTSWRPPDDFSDPSTSYAHQTKDFTNISSNSSCYTESVPESTQEVFLAEPVIGEQSSVKSNWSNDEIQIDPLLDIQASAIDVENPI